MGDLASKTWKNSPKFNSPEARNELEQFAEEVYEECSMPEVGFDMKGIIQHVRDFNEQRRHKKRVSIFPCTGSALSFGQSVV